MNVQLLEMAYTWGVTHNDFLQKRQELMREPIEWHWQSCLPKLLKLEINTVKRG